MRSILRAYVDLMRLQFFFAWPILFSSGYLLAVSVYGGFSWFALVRVALIGFFGFEAGLVLNDYVDREFDRKDTEKDKLTRTGEYSGPDPSPRGSFPRRTPSGLSFYLHLLPPDLS